MNTFKVKQVRINALVNAFLLFSMLSATSFADPVVLPVKSKPFGQSYKEWAIDFSRWAYSMPPDTNVVYNPNFTDCTAPQHGKVWFVATNAKEASCTIPNGKAVFVHVGFYMDTYPCPAPPVFEPAPGQRLDEFLTLDAKNIMDGFTPHSLFIDGKPIINGDLTSNLRLSTGLFSFTGNIALKELDPCVTGKKQYAVTDGYFALIDGLKPGTHIFDYYNSHTGEHTNTLKLTVTKDRIRED